MALLAAHVCLWQHFGLWAQHLPIHSGKDLNVEAVYGLFGLGCTKEWKMNGCRCEVLARAHRNTNLCACLIAQEEVCQRYTNFTLLSLWERGPLRVQKHFNNAYMPTLHVMHQPNLLMPPNKFHRCTAGNVQSHSCVGRWVILKLFLRFHFITPQCHLYVLLRNMRFIKESIPGSCRNNIRETGRNQRSLCFLSGVLTVIPMCPLRGKSYSTWAPHNTNNSLFDLRWKSSAWFKAVFFKDTDG